jgi:hypothetical protein
MEWLTWFPSIHWQHAALALALVALVVALLMAVRPRSRRSRRKAI